MICNLKNSDWQDWNYVFIGKKKNNMLKRLPRDSEDIKIAKSDLFYKNSTS